MSMISADIEENLSYENILSLFRKTDDPVLTAPEVADVFDVSTQAANYRLKKLVDRNELRRKRVGGAAVVYWTPRH
ncbi:winged helix-turn-helix domain-containing protein [Haloarcula brevis]|uniref:winged helix-turn-helix domain-containing protein n=1 Tax=Haloarcula brevis TaxID=3111453 RepID=UPI00300F2D65